MANRGGDPRAKDPELVAKFEKYEKQLKRHMTHEELDRVFEALKEARVAIAAHYDRVENLRPGADDLEVVSRWARGLREYNRQRSLTEILAKRAATKNPSEKER